MANIEGQPAQNEAESRDEAFSHQGFSIEVPTTEELGAGAGEFHDKTIQARAEALTNMMDEGMPKEKYADLWAKVETQVINSRRENASSELATYLSNPDDAQAFSRLVADLQADKPWNDILAREADMPSASSLKAIEVLSGVINEVLRVPEQTSDGSKKTWDQFTGDELSKRLLRVSEIANSEAKVIKIEHELLSPEELSEQGGYIKQFNALVNSADVPYQFKERLSDTTFELRVREIAAEAVAPSSSATQPESIEANKEVSDSSPEPMAEKKAALPEASSEEPRPKPEKVFGHEAVKAEDARAASVEINSLLKENTPDSLFKAARELAHLKRAKLNIAERHREKVFNQLLLQREGIQQQGSAATARYLTYLKYLGAIKEINSQEKTLIGQGIHERMEKGGMKNLQSQDLSQLCVNAKYLGIELPIQSMAPHFEQEIERVNRPGSEQRVAYRLGRAKYLGVASEKLTTVAEQTKGPTNSKLAEFRAKGLWDNFAKLQTIVNYLRGETAVDAKAQTEMVNYVTKARERSKESGRWHNFVAYLGTITGLSEQLQEKPKQTIQMQDPVIHFLNQLSERNIETPVEFFGRLSEQDKAADQKRDDLSAATRRRRAA